MNSFRKNIFVEENVLGPAKNKNQKMVKMEKFKNILTDVYTKWLSHESKLNHHTDTLVEFFGSYAFGYALLSSDVDFLCWGQDTDFTKFNSTFIPHLTSTLRQKNWGELTYIHSRFDHPLPYVRFFCDEFLVDLHFVNQRL